MEHACREAPPAWQDLLLGKTEVVRTGPDRGAAALIFSGAFNPWHAGHQRMARIAQETLGQPTALEISIVNVDKPPLDYIDIDRRLAQFPPDQTVYLTHAATFEEKSRLFARATFIVGADTLRRVADSKYHGRDTAAWLAAIEQIAARGCRFLVFCRRDNGHMVRLADVELPGTCAPSAARSRPRCFARTSARRTSATRRADLHMRAERVAGNVLAHLGGKEEGAGDADEVVAARQAMNGLPGIGSRRCKLDFATARCRPPTARCRLPTAACRPHPRPLSRKRARGRRLLRPDPQHFCRQGEQFLGRDTAGIVLVARENHAIEVREKVLEHTGNIFSWVVAKTSKRRRAEKLSASVSTNDRIEAALCAASRTTAGRRERTSIRAGHVNSASRAARPARESPTRPAGALARPSTRRSRWPTDAGRAGRA